jgi:CHAT domain-containing protein
VLERTFDVPEIFNSPTSNLIFPEVQRINAPESEYLWQWQTGRLLKAKGEIGPAIAAYQRAIYSLQAIRHDLSTGDLTDYGSFRQRFSPIFLELVDLLLRRSAQASDAARVDSYLQQVRQAIELLKGAELEDYFQDDCVTALKGRTKGIDKLAPRTAAVYPIPLPDRLEILLSLPTGMKRFTFSVAADSLVREVRVLRQLLEKRTTREYLPHAQRLYDWIIRPIEKELQRDQIEILVFVPDGALRTIPMAALHDGNEFLISQYAIASTPGLTLTDPHPLARQHLEILLSGLTKPVQGFPPVPNVRQELSDIKALYGGTVLEDQSFIIPTLERELKQRSYTVIHIASHGQFGQDIKKTFILTYDDKLSMDALQRDIGMTRYRDNPVELLTLSACQTAAGDDRAALGLAGVALKAGARSALATLWSVNDKAAALLVTDFYRELQGPAISKARALQKAQLALIHDQRYRHPGYWSPFLLIGDWL